MRNEPHPDVIEITIGAADVDIVATYGRMARSTFVVDKGTTGVLKVKTEAGEDRTYTGFDDKEMVEPSPANITKIYGTTEGTTTVTKVRIGL